MCTFLKNYKYIVTDLHALFLRNRYLFLNGRKAQALLHGCVRICKSSEITLSQEYLPLKMRNVSVQNKTVPQNQVTFHFLLNRNTTILLIRKLFLEESSLKQRPARILPIIYWLEIFILQKLCVKIIYRTGEMLYVAMRSFSPPTWARTAAVAAIALQSSAHPEWRRLFLEL